MTVRLAVVGCGAISHWHLDAIQRGGIRHRRHGGDRPRRRRTPRRVADAPARPRSRRWTRRSPRVASTPRSIAVPHHLHEAGRHRGARRRAARAAREAARADARRVRPHPRRGRRGRHRVHGRGERAVLARGADRARPDRRRRDRRRRHRARQTFFPALGDFYGGDRPWRFDKRGRGRRRRRSTPARTGSARCACGSARSTRSSPRSATRIPTWRASRCAARCCASSRAWSPSFDAMLTTGAIAPAAAVPRHRQPRRDHRRGLGLGEAVRRHRLEGHQGRRAGRLPAARTRASGPTSRRRCSTARRPRPRRSTRSASCALALAMYRSAETRRWEKVWE